LNVKVPKQTTKTPLLNISQSLKKKKKVFFIASYIRMWYYQIEIKEFIMIGSENQQSMPEALPVKQKVVEQMSTEQKVLAEKQKDSASGFIPDDIERLTQFADYLTRINMAEYIKLTQKPARLMWFNFLSGLARGFGIAVGFTLLGAFGIYILRQLQVLNLPLIGDFVAQIWEYVEMARGIRI
jgi:hypothetical protein